MSFIKRCRTVANSDYIRVDTTRLAEMLIAEHYTHEDMVDAEVGEIEGYVIENAVAVAEKLLDTIIDEDPLEPANLRLVSNNE